MHVLTKQESMFAFNIIFCIIVVFTVGKSTAKVTLRFGRHDEQAQEAFGGHLTWLLILYPAQILYFYQSFDILIVLY